MRRRAKPIPPPGSEPTDPTKKRLEQFKEFEERAVERRSEYQGKLLERKTERRAEDAARTTREQEKVRKEEKQKQEEERLAAVWKKQQQEEEKTIQQMKQHTKEEGEYLNKLKEEEELRLKHQKEYMKNLEDKAVLKHRQEILKLRAEREERAKKTAQEHFTKAMVDTEHDEVSALDALNRETRKLEANAKGEIALARQRLAEETRQRKMELERKRKMEESKIKRQTPGPAGKVALQNLEKNTAQKLAAIDKQMNDQKKALDQREQGHVREIEKEYEKKKSATLNDAAGSRQQAQRTHDQLVSAAERHTQEEDAADTRQEERHKMDNKFSGKDPGE